MKINNRVVLTVGGGVVAIGALFYIANVVVPQVLVTLTKAAPATVVSLSNSYLLGEKILAKADGEDTCIVNVYLLDERSQGVRGKQVIVDEEVKVTDAVGKARFELTSDKEEQVSVEAMVEGVPLPRTLKCTFRNE